MFPTARQLCWRCFEVTRILAKTGGRGKQILIVDLTDEEMPVLRTLLELYDGHWMPDEDGSTRRAELDDVPSEEFHQMVQSFGTAFDDYNQKAQQIGGSTELADDDLVIATSAKGYRVLAGKAAGFGAGVGSISIRPDCNRLSR